MYCEKQKFRVHAENSSFFPQQNLDFKDSIDVEMSLEDDQNKRSNDYFVQKVQLIKKSKNACIIQRGIYIDLNLGVVVRLSLHL